MDAKELLTKKEQMCSELAGLGIKKISNQKVAEVGQKYDLTKAQSIRAWQTFQETGGKLDRRFRKNSTVKTIKMKATKSLCSKSRDVSPAEAAKIILEYMQSNCTVTSRDLSVKYSISVVQFYNWIRELNVSGTLLGKRVLNPSKYAKLNVLDAIWIKRNPKTQRKSITRLTSLELAALKRVSDVLEKYLVGLTE